MKTVIEQINAVLPGFEAAAYDKYALKGWDDDDFVGDLDAFDQKVVLSPARKALQRRYIARGAYCREMVENGLPFLVARTAIKHVRTEIHSFKYPDGWENGHHFISIPADPDNRDVLSDEDVVVDPTYLQFAGTESAREMRPLVFVGTRQAIKYLMADPTFDAKQHTEQMYDPASLDFIA